MFLMRGGGGLIKVKGGGGGWWETRYISYHKKFIVLYRSVTFIRGNRDYKSTIANNSTGHPLGGSRWLELSVYVLPPASTTI